MLDPRACPELLTPAEMGLADRFAIAHGTPGIDLMERAGLAVADVAARYARSRGRVAILCGPGGNGGDGFIAGRLMAERGYRVELGLLGPRDALRGDAALAAERFAVAVRSIGEIDLDQADCVIDALFGAGLARDIDGEAAIAIERVNAFARSGRPVVAVDVPSGIDGATGLVRGAAVEATASVTFFRLKPGHLLLPGRARCGALHLADIGIPAGALATIAPAAFVNAPAIWLSALPRPGLDVAQIFAWRGAGSLRPRASDRRGASRRARRAAGRRGDRGAGEPARRGRDQRRALHFGDGRAVRLACAASRRCSPTSGGARSCSGRAPASEPGRASSSRRRSIRAARAGRSCSTPTR